MENPDQDKDTCPAADMETLANTAQPAVPDYTCHICGYKPRASASNPKEALRKHMARYHANETTEQAVDAIVSDVLESSAKVEDCDKLYEDIQILKVKFPDIAYTPDIHPDSSYQALKRAKNTLVRLVNDRSGADAAFNIMLIGTMSTVLVNGNPLLKFDGYFVLADALEMPNLAARANRYAGYLLRRYGFGFNEAQ